MHSGIYAVFEFNWNSSAESDVNTVLIYVILNYPDKTNKTWIFKRVFLKLG